MARAIEGWLSTIDLTNDAEHGEPRLLV